jgi:hypothetical protein
MPRSTLRKQVLASLSLLLEERQRKAQERFVMKDESDIDDNSTMEGMLDAAVVSFEKTVRHQRYFAPRQKYRMKKKSLCDVFKRDL